MNDTISKVYIVSLEGEGDGSNNFVGFVRPGISVFTQKKLAARAIYKYIESEDLLEDLFEELVDTEYDLENLDIKFEEWRNQVLLKKCVEIVENGGYKIDEMRWIRVEKIGINGLTLNEHHYSQWEI